MKDGLAGFIARNSAKVIRRTGYFMMLTAKGEKLVSDELARNPDRILEQTPLIKHSKTTTAALVSCQFSGSETDQIIFLKRTNNKGLKFTIRYLFRRARVFRAAWAAETLLSLGIQTPEILGVGERRFGRILRSGYLITGSAPGIHSVEQGFAGCAEPKLLADRFLDFAGRNAALLHLHGVIHGDMKLSNFYFCGDWSEETQFGIWDLDGIRRFPGNRVPMKLKIRELGRIAASLHVIACRTKSIAEDAQNGTFSLANIIRRLLICYQNTAPSVVPPDFDAVAHFAEARVAHLTESDRRET